MYHQDSTIFFCPSHLVSFLHWSLTHQHLLFRNVPTAPHKTVILLLSQNKMKQPILQRTHGQLTATDSERMGTTTKIFLNSSRPVIL